MTKRIEQDALDMRLVLSEKPYWVVTLNGREMGRYATSKQARLRLRRIVKANRKGSVK